MDNKIAEKLYFTSESSIPIKDLCFKTFLYKLEMEYVHLFDFWKTKWCKNIEKSYFTYRCNKAN
jgi:hypothetical protein